jgi:molybdopterin-synthase adenylyltransferase
MGTMLFSYTEMITRNIGFVSESEQTILRNTRVFVPGVGGMGGAVVACLARIGIEHFILADIDTFEVSNLNRQIFATLDVIGEDKAKVTKKMLQKINPNIKITLYEGDWVSALDTILKETDVVVNGCDAIAPTIQLLRKCKAHQVSVIDAFASPLPNVYVVRPTDKRPEEYLNFPTQGIDFEDISPELEKKCLQKEIEHVAIHSTSLSHVDLNIAKEIMNGTRKRISFAPMVWTTGCMMAYEVVKLQLHRKASVGKLGVFFNPWNYTIEKPKNRVWAILLRIMAQAMMRNF